MCYVHNQWYDISCATLYIIRNVVWYTVTAVTMELVQSHVSEVSRATPLSKKLNGTTCDKL